MQQWLPDWSQQKQSSYCRQLLDSGLVEPHQDGLKASHRWHAAMARSALALIKSKEQMQDERLAVVLSLRELLTPIPDDDVLCDLVLLMQLIEHIPDNDFGSCLKEG